MGKCGPHLWCLAMFEALRNVPENYDGKGLSVSRGWLGDEQQPRLLGVTYKRKRGDDGIVLNFCPWCGHSIRFDEPGKEGG